jgi:hypothetical protein
VDVSLLLVAGVPLLGALLLLVELRVQLVALIFLGVDRGFDAESPIPLVQKSPEFVVLEILTLRLHIDDDESLLRLCDRLLRCR